ncbi:MAG: metallophosphoesterase [Clostridia bacterium]|nr:metallophosphoesterase [Clostridia bacterium]
MTIVYIIIGITIFCSIFYLLNYQMICVSKYKITDKKIPKSFDGYKALHLSDWHCTNYGKNNSRLLRIIKKQDYDVMFVSGDFAVRQTHEYLPAIEFLKELTDKPIYFIWGNHELALTKEEYLDFWDKLDKIGVRVVENEHIALSKGNDKILLYGLRYNSKDEDTRYIKKQEIQDKYYNNYVDALGKLDKTKYNILLTHDPMYYDVYVREGFDLVYAGHLHGGAIRILGFCLSKLKTGLVITRLGAGMKKKESTKMIVSRGIGNSTIPIRVFNPPEMSITTFYHKD